MQGIFRLAKTWLPLLLLLLRLLLILLQGGAKRLPLRTIKCLIIRLIKCLIIRLASSWPTGCITLHWSWCTTAPTTTCTRRSVHDQTHPTLIRPRLCMHAPQQITSSLPQWLRKHVFTARLIKTHGVKPPYGCQVSAAPPPTRRAVSASAPRSTQVCGPWREVVRLGSSASTVRQVFVCLSRGSSASCPRS